ncbi:MAG: methyltransferase domain-containing protein [Phycisphaerales bacterium]|nr:methyltransferase domain-containing protein [Phycisphaerales bacterium]
MERTVEPELMDDPGVDRADLDRSLAYIRGVNRWLGGTRGLLANLKRWSRRWPRGKPVTLLDIGTGSADIPLAARRWAMRRGFDLRVTGVDLHAATLEAARGRVGDEPGIELIQADALRLMDLFTPGSFDYVHAGMFLHHLSFIEVLTVLRIMDRLARAGLVWNDLVRSRLSLALLRPALLGRAHIIRHDALASVRAGFTRAEVTDVARRVGLDYTRYRNVLAYRFTLAGEKPGAWPR